MKLTKSQAAGLELVRAAIAKGWQGGPTSFRGERTIKTGVNTHVLSNLHNLGILKCSNIYLRGVITADAQIIES